MAAFHGVLPPIGLCQLIAEPAILVGDRALTARAIAALSAAACSAPLAYGPSMSVVLCPIDVVVGEGQLLLGRPDEAVAPFERGAALARRLAAPSYVARATSGLVSALTACGRAGDRERIRALEGEAVPQPAAITNLSPFSATPFARVTSRSPPTMSASRSGGEPESWRSHRPRGSATSRRCSRVRTVRSTSRS